MVARGGRSSSQGGRGSEAQHLPKNRQIRCCLSLSVGESLCVCVCELKLFQFHCCSPLLLPLPALLPAPCCALSSLAVWKFTLCARAEQLKKCCKFFDLFYYTFSFLFWLCISSSRVEEGGNRSPSMPLVAQKPLKWLDKWSGSSRLQLLWQGKEGNPCQHSTASLHSFNCQFAIVLVAASSSRRSN